MKKIRIGCGSGGCTWERMEPTIELLEKGRLDYLIFECLAERTIAAAQKEKLQNPAKGYNPMLETRMRKVLPLAKQNGVKIVSNMGAANTQGAVDAIVALAREAGLVENVPEGCRRAPGERPQPRRTSATLARVHNEASPALRRAARVFTGPPQPTPGRGLAG